MALVQSVLKQFRHEPNQSYYLTSISCFVGILFVLMLTRRRNKSINLPPSPPKLPIIGNLHQLGSLPHRSFHALAQKYGPLMLLQLGQNPTLVVSSSDVAKEIIKTHDVVFSNRPQPTAAKVFVYGCKDIAFGSYGEEWRQKRKVCVLELLSLKRVKSFQSIREEEVAELVGEIREACAKTGSCVNLSEMFISISNNIVSRCVLGQKYDTPNDGSDTNFGELGRKLMRIFTAFSVGDFFPSLGWIDNLTGLIPEMNTIFVALDAFFDEVIEEHKRMRMMKRGGKSESVDFVDIMLQLQETGMLDFELTGNNLKAILMDMFVGGSDTTSTALEWIFAELIKNPNIMKKTQEEVRRIVGGTKSRVDENDVNQMNYLKCVIKETLRLHPPIPLLLPRETLSDVKLRGYNIPPKTRVFLNAWTMQRDPELWNNPEEFIPERFENNQVDFKGVDFQLIPFGTGRRGCPGILFGVTSTEHVLANLLYWFDWKLPDEVGDIDMSEVHGLTVSKKVPLHLQPVLYSPGSD